MSAAIEAQSTQRAEQSMAPLSASSQAPDVADELEKLGLKPHEHYFQARAAPLGAASLELVVATFFNLNPRAVGRAIPGAWDKATPRQILAAQMSGIDRALRRAFARLDATIVKEALALLRPVTFRCGTWSAPKTPVRTLYAAAWSRPARSRAPGRATRIKSRGSV